MRGLASETSAAWQRWACQLSGAASDYDPLMEAIGEARFVLLGEATHGTHEFYKARAQITKKLIEEKNFSAVTWEADWPDALRVNRYLRGHSEDSTAQEALAGFQRFPTWIWRNSAVLEFVQWVHDHNAHLPRGRSPVAVHGMDLYSLRASMNAVIDYLEKKDPRAAQEARKRYSCFEDFGATPEAYGLSASLDPSLSCEEEVVEQLRQLQGNKLEQLKQASRLATDELFIAEQNTRVARHAEQYYRALFRGQPNTWNLRDSHMQETLDRLAAHLGQQGAPSKVVVWAHNSHLGDARATEQRRPGKHNLGQLMRQKHGEETFLVGFTTYRGTVTAASEWGGVAECKPLRPALDESYEALFHEAKLGNFFLSWRDDPERSQAWEAPRLERAVGVIYRPDTERLSHYLRAQLAHQFDAVVHLDETCAVEPLEPSTEWKAEKFAESFPNSL